MAIDFRFIRVFCVLILPLILLFPDGLVFEVDAGAAVGAQRQAVQRKAAYERALQERAYQQAYQQRVAQQRAAVAQQAAYQQQISQLTYQRQIAQQQRAQQEQLYLQRQIQAHQARSAREFAAYQQAALAQNQGDRQQASVPQAVSRPQYYPSSPDINSLQNSADYLPPDEVVNIYDLWDEMVHSSEVWRMMMDRRPKEETVRKYIDFFRQQNVIVRKSPGHYVDLIDQMSARNSDMLQRPFEDVFRLLTIMEYDFDNGEDPDALARQVLGEQVYQQNRQRLGR